MALAIDGSAHAGNGSTGSLSVNLTTSNANDYILVGIYHQDFLTSVSSPTLGTFTKIAEENNGGQYSSFYAAFSTGTLTSETISVVCNSSAGRMAVDAFGVSGSNQSSLVWDAGGPVTSTSSPTNFTNSTADCLILSASSLFIISSAGAGTGFTAIPGSDADFQLCQYKLVSSTGTTSVGSQSSNDWATNAMAIIGVPLAAGGGGGTAYTLTASTGSYSLSGQASVLKRAIKMAAVTGTYALSGKASILKKGKTLTAVKGAYTVTGVAANLKRALKPTAVTGTYSLSGKAAILSSARKMPAVTGTYALTGKAANLPITRKITAAQGTYSVSGQTANTVRSIKLTAATGTYTLTGKTANTLVGRKITGAQGTYSVSGQSANTVKSIKLTAATGSYILSGQGAVLSSSSGPKNYSLTASTGSYILSGQASILRSGRVLTATQGSYSLSGQSASFHTSKTLAAAKGTYTLSGQAVAFKHSYKLTVEAGAYSLSGQAANLVYTPNAGPVAYKLTADKGSYRVTGFDLAYTPEGLGGKMGEWVRRYVDHGHTKIKPQVFHRIEQTQINKSAAILAKAGGHARAESLTAKQRSNIASVAAKARWK